MPKIIYGGLLKKRIKQSMIENEFNKKNEKLTLIANELAKKNKNIRKFKPIIYGDLYNKRIAESEKENIINKRLSQLAYSARNGQRQPEIKPQQGVIYPGQVALLNQPPVISAITKQMIDEYHEAEKLKPLIIDGEIRKYNKALYNPSLTFDTELETTDKIDRLTEEYNAKKMEIAKKMTDIDDEIIRTDDYIKRLKNNPLTSAINYITLQKEIKLKEDLKNEYKQLENEMNLTNIQIRNLKDAYDNVIKHNAEVGERNREEVKKFEQSLNEVNKNRLNLQQQPNETDYDYYKRLQEIEKERYDPLLFKQYAENEQTKTLKNNLNSLFDNTTFKEEILSYLSPEDKFIINQNFDDIQEAYLDEYGYNNRVLNPKRTSEILSKFSNIYKNEAVTTLQSFIRRKEQEEKKRVKRIRDYENGLKQKRIQLTNEEEENKENKAAEKLQSLFRGHKGRKEAKRIQLTNEERQQSKAINYERKQKQNRLQAEEDAINRMLVERSKKQYLEQENKAKEAAEKLQSVFRGHKGRKEAELVKPIRMLVESSKKQYLEQENKEKEAAEKLQSFIRRKEAERVKRIRDYENRLKQKRIQLTNEEIESKGINYERKQKQNRLQAEEDAINRMLVERSKKQYLEQENKAIKAAEDLQRFTRKKLKENEVEKQQEAAEKIQSVFRGHEGRRERIHTQIKKSERNNAAKKLQRFARKKLAENEYNTEKKIEELKDIYKNYKAAEIINNNIRNQLAKRELNKLKANKEAKQKYKNINPSYNLEYNPPPLSSEPFVPKFIQEANERKRKNKELYERYKKTYYPSSDLATNNESFEKEAAAEKIQSVFRGHQGRKEKIHTQIKKSESNNAAKKLQSVFRGHKVRKEVKPTSPSEAGATTFSEASTIFEKIRKQRSDKGIPRGPYKEKRPVGRPPKKRTLYLDIESNREEDYEPPAARTEKGTGLRGRYNPKKRIVKTTKEQQMKNRLFLITKEIKAGNDNPKLIIESDKLYKNLYGIENAHLFLKK